MTPAGEMTDRPIPSPAPAADDLRMDEATIDCSLCGRPGWLEARVERLNEHAEWATRARWTVCQEHTDALRMDHRWLLGTDRVVLMRCG